MIKSSVELVTPALAEEFLALNIDNRTIRPMTVNQYANDMACGRWKLNGEAIIFDKSGLLIDGQHRLRAVLKAGVGVSMLITRGVDREARDTININRVRGAGDVLQMFHIQNGNGVAAVARLVIAYERADRRSLGQPSQISKTAQLDRARSDARIAECYRFAHAMEPIMPRKIGALARYLIPQTVASDRFFTGIIDGAALGATDPILILRNWWLRNGRRQPDARGLEVIFRAWCAYRDGRNLTTLRVVGEIPQP